MRMGCSFVFVCCCVVCSLLILLSNAPSAAAVTCNPLALSSCLSSFTSSAPPSAACCSELKGQVPCFCQYLRNPALRGYVASPNGRRVASTCGVPYPTAC